MNKLKKPILNKKKAELFAIYIDNVKYKFSPGAAFTTDFGYTAYSGKGYEEYPGLHAGTDRNYRGASGFIFSPFNFPKSGFKDWKGKWWGSDVYLFHPYNFRLRISHMFPNKIVCLNKLKSKLAIKQNELIGEEGSYGNVTGEHTHVELESWGFKGQWLTSCDILDWLLYFKFGEKALLSFSSGDIIKIARTKCKGNSIKKWSDKFILEHFEQLMKNKSIVFINKYKFIRRDAKTKKLTTLYDSLSTLGF